jgi:hypothetical protein
MRKTKSMEKRDVHDLRATRPVLHSVMLTMCSIAAWCSLCANPVVSKVTVTPDGGSVFKIGYTLTGGPAIVTVDVLTNGVSIGEVNFTNMTGAVNKQVSAGQNVICWQPRDSWADHRIAAGGISVNVKAWPLCAPPPYMVVDLYQEGNGYLNDGVYVHYFASTNAFPGGFENRAYKTTTIVMRHIPAAGVRWRMGSDIPVALVATMSGRRRRETGVVAGASLAFARPCEASLAMVATSAGMATM